MLGGSVNDSIHIYFTPRRGLCNGRCVAKLKKPLDTDVFRVRLFREDTETSYQAEHNFISVWETSVSK